MRLHSWVVWVVAGLLSAFLLRSAYRMYPIPDVDAAAFLPQAINLARGNGLVNPMYTRAAPLDSASRGQVYYYPPLFSIAVAGLMPEPNARGAFTAVALIDTAALVLAALLLLRVVRLGAGDGRGRVALLAGLVCLALLGLAGQMKNGAGRPESLGMLIVAATGILGLRRPTPGAGTIAVGGVLLGMMGATQPFGGVLLGCLMTGWVLATHRGRAAAGLVALLGATATATFEAIALASATDLRFLLQGLAQNARLTLLPTRRGGTLWEYYVTGVRSPLLGVLLLAALGAAAALLWNARRRIASPAWLVATFMAAALATWFLTLRTPTRYYNLAMMAPAAYAVLIAWIASRTAPGRRGRGIWATLAVLLFAGAGAGFVRRLLLYAPTMRTTRSWEQGRADFRRVAEGAEPVQISHSLWALSEDYDRLHLAFPWKPPCGHALLLRQQAASRRLSPPELPGHTRIYSSFTPVKPTVFGLPLGRSVGGYGFAAYVPRADGPPPDCARAP